MSQQERRKSKAFPVKCGKLSFLILTMKREAGEGLVKENSLLKNFGFLTLGKSLLYKTMQLANASYFSNA